MSNTKPNTLKAVIITRIPQLLLDALDKHSATQNISREEALRQAVSEYTNTPYTYTHASTKYATPAEHAQANKLQARNRKRAQRERKALQANYEETIAILNAQRKSQNA